MYKIIQNNLDNTKSNLHIFVLNKVTNSMIVYRNYFFYSLQFFYHESIQVHIDYRLDNGSEYSHNCKYS